MKLGIVAAPAPRGPAVRLGVVDVRRATLHPEVTAARRARLVATYPYPAAFRRALRAVLRSP